MLFQTCLTDFLLLNALFFILLCLPYIESQWDPVFLLLDPTDLNCTDKNSLQNVIFFCVQENMKSSDAKASKCHLKFSSC